MNRYQAEVAEMDRKFRLRARVLSALGAGVLAVLALWSAGLPPSKWWTGVQAWISDFDGIEGQPIAKGVEKRIATSVTSAPTVGLIEEKAALGTDSSASAVPLDLLLIRTVPGRSHREGTALIGTAPENPQTYATGALLANGARLVEVHADHVVLQRDGKSARLDIFDPNKNASRSKTANPLFLVGGQKPVRVAGPTVEDSLIDYVRPSPVFDGAHMRGIQVYPGARSAVFSEFGLRAGDLIVAIDGTALVDAKQALDLLRELTNGATLSASVVRNEGTSQTIVMNGSAILAEQERTRLAASAQEPSLPMP